MISNGLKTNIPVGTCSSASVGKSYNFGSLTLVATNRIPFEDVGYAVPAPPLDLYGAMSGSRGYGGRQVSEAS